MRKTIKLNKSEDLDRNIIHIIVRNAVDNTEIGEAKIELDDLIDPKL